MLKTLLQQPVEKWKDSLVNDFELPVFEKYPEIKTIKDHLYQQGALYASMSGSGSTVFGIFNKAINHLTDNLFPPHYFVKQLDLPFDYLAILDLCI